mgnify:CR=1 FL=1
MPKDKFSSGSWSKIFFDSYEINACQVLRMFGGIGVFVVAALSGADLGLQIVAFCVVSLLMIGFVRPVALKHLHKGPADRRSNVERLIGESALVMEPVTATGGLVKIGGDVWSARSETGVLAQGQHAIVSPIDGATAVVAPQPETAIQ